MNYFLHSFMLAGVRINWVTVGIWIGAGLFGGFGWIGMALDMVDAYLGR